MSLLLIKNILSICKHKIILLYVGINIYKFDEWISLYETEYWLIQGECTLKINICE